MWRKKILLVPLFVFSFSEHLFSMEPKLTFGLASPCQTDSVIEKNNRKNTFYTIRLGVGGFSDNRAPSGKLMGAQLMFDAKPFKYPFAVSISLIEFYSSSSDPEYSYQIQNMGTLNIFYTTKPFKTKRLKIFCGGGIGGLQVPKDEPKHEDDYAVGLFYDLEAGINYHLFKKIGIYGTVKYLYAQKKRAGINLIDFNEVIYVMGVSFNIGF